MARLGSSSPGATQAGQATQGLLTQRITVPSCFTPPSGPRTPARALLSTHGWSRQGTRRSSCPRSQRRAWCPGNGRGPPGVRGHPPRPHPWPAVRSSSPSKRGPWGQGVDGWWQASGCPVSQMVKSTALLIPGPFSAATGVRCLFVMQVLAVILRLCGCRDPPMLWGATPGFQASIDPSPSLTPILGWEGPGHVLLCVCFQQTTSPLWPSVSPFVWPVPWTQ